MAPVRSIEDLMKLNKQVQNVIRKCNQVEEYLWPSPDDGWLSNIALQTEQGSIIELLVGFRAVMQRWQQGVILPVDQLVLTIAQDLF